MTVYDCIQLLKEEGSRLAKPVSVEGMPSMTFSCSFSPSGATPQELSTVRPCIPQDLADFWAICRTARLFEDQEYGQWGLEIFAPQQSADATSQAQAVRSLDFLSGDLVIGSFLGDSDLFVIRVDPTVQDFGSVLVALPIDPRKEWYRVAESFGTFLESFAKAGGEKYWTNS